MMKQYNESLTDDDLKKFSLIHFDGNVVLVDDMRKFRHVIEDIRRSELLGFDTETKPSFRKGRRNRVSLLQLADDNNAWLFRLNMTGLPPELAELLSDKNITKVGVAIHDDIRSLKQLADFEPGGFIDLQNVVSVHGIKQPGLRKLSAIVLGHSISKSQQVSNWEATELSPAQQLYAATDAWVCRKIYLALNGSVSHQK